VRCFVICDFLIRFSLCLRVSDVKDRKLSDNQPFSFRYNPANAAAAHS
jgi:hypothetical protein